MAQLVAHSHCIKKVGGVTTEKPTIRVCKELGKNTNIIPKTVSCLRSQSSQRTGGGSYETQLNLMIAASRDAATIAAANLTNFQKPN
jgi:hypothetical protein